MDKRSGTRVAALAVVGGGRAQISTNSRNHDPF
jgi:hypothetical protein